MSDKIVMTSTDIFLEHFGVKGMQWGVRRDKKSKSSVTDSTRYKAAPKTLTNDELNKRIKRMETEKRYNELNKKTVSAGQKHAMDILTQVGKSNATKILGAVSLYGVKVAIDRKFGEGKSKDIFPKKG